MPITAHLEELRRRLIICAVAVGIGFAGCYYFAPKMFAVLMAPLVRALPPESTLIFTGVTEAFFTYLKVAILAGFFVSSPLVLYEIWAFVSPGLYTKEKRYVIPFVIFSTIFFVGGALFGYFVVFPYGFKFLLGFASEQIRPYPRIREYFSLASKMLLAFGAVFELPLFVFFLAKMGIVNSRMLVRQFKYALLIIFSISAILTPPDVATQLMMAGPLLCLYGVSIVVARVFGKEAKKEKEDDSEESETGGD
ncbi:MAG: twin-arginine translocase subunit TatC [Deltaproteobacteria bacterium]|nr:twin-arginine translocase subunit TatC [Deltaproteobacteria bacterium]